MSRLVFTLLRRLASGVGCVCALVGGVAAAEVVEARFVRAINLNGPALRIDGRAWEGGETTNLVVTGKEFENQRVPLKPPTDPARASMIRSSRWGSRVEVSFTGLAPGPYQLFLYVWEDNHSERFDLWVNDRAVLEGFHSGGAGSWKRLGPWLAEPVGGTLTLSARAASHGAANLSGIELWSGAGPVPTSAAGGFADGISPEQTLVFESKVRPLLVERCYDCHSAGAKKIGGGLLLDSRAGVMKGGDTGPAVAPGDPEASLLIQAVRHTDASLTMPPKKKLEPHEIAVLEEWVRAGAPDPRTDDTVAAAKSRSTIDWGKAREWWAFRPLTQPAAPVVAHGEWPRGDLDRFVLERIEREGLQPAADAPKATLLRRVTYDLTGLPPTPAELASFVGDTAPDAFARRVDRLLASSQYGERWGRHWLDVVRYSDSAGDNSDFPIPQMHRYRDWVIGAFNRDLPYDRFIKEQLAGDLLPAADPASRLDQVIATGYIANARRFGSRVDDYPQHLTIEDTIDNVGRTFLGLTVSCARCHDHKFDPIPTADYYGLYGIFHSTRYPWPGIELEQRQRDLVPLVQPEKLAEAEATLRTRETELRRLQKEVQRLKDELKKEPEATKAALETKIKEAEAAVDRHRNTPLPFALAYAVAEGSRFEDAAIQQKGDPARPGPVVKRRFLTVLNGGELSAGERENGSGRLQLAEWLASDSNPLSDRVMVNRVWQHHFGRGLVATPNDFGRQGVPPTHPGLLDWLALRFQEEGRSVKALHRLIVLSRTYQLSSERVPEAMTRDPRNETLASFPRRRLDAEALRDTLMALGGSLDLRPGPAHPFPAEHTWKFTQHNPFKAVYPSAHRSVYLMTQRIQRNPYLAIFDGADPSASTPVRTASTTPLQALYLLNDAFVHEQAERFAQRLLAEVPADQERTRRAFEMAVGRAPTESEQEQAARFRAEVRVRIRGDGASEAQLERQVWAALMRVLFRLNEFVYID